MGKLVFRVASDWQEVVRLRTEIEKLKQTLLSMDSNQSPDTFKKLNAQLGESSKKMNILITEAAKAGAVMEGDFKKKIFDASQTVNGFTEKIITQKNAIKGFEQDLRALQEEYRKITKNGGKSQDGLDRIHRMKNIIAEEKDALFNLTQQQANARLSVKKLRDEYSLYKNEGKQVVETNNGITISWKKALTVIGGVGVLKALVSEIIRVRGEFQSMQTAIETMVGKDVAGKIMPQIKELAKISPLTMTDMVGAEKMMLGFNIQAEDTIKYLKAISDISMGESSKFNSLTLAFSQMSAAGKLMGQDLNQMINAGFNPLQVIAEKTGKSIVTLKEEMSKGAISAEMVQQAFIDATSAGGKFYGMSENASQTINGQISMMQDAWDNALNEIGQSSEGLIMSGIQATTSLIQNYETVGKVLVGLIATYGVYRTALITNIALTRGWAVAARADAVAKGLQTIATKAQTAAQLALNSAMKVNPYVLAATLIMGVASAMWAFHDSATETEKAQKRFNEQQKEAAKQEQEHKQKIDSLVDSARDIALADLQRGESLAELRKEYPKIFAKYDIESIKLADILQLKRQIADEDARRAGEKKQKELTDVESEIKYYENLLKLLSGQQGADGYVKKLKELRADRDVLLQEKGKGISEQFIASLKGIDISSFDRYITELEKRIKGKGENGKVKLRLPIDAKGSLSDEAIYDVKDIKTLIDTARTAKKTAEEAAKAEKKTGKEWLDYYKGEYEEADKAYNDFLKSKTAMSDADRDKELKRLKGLRDEAKKTYESKGGVISSSSKQESEAEKQKKEREATLKAEAQRQEELLALRRQNQQDEINLMKDGSDKKLKQIELDYQKEIDAIKKQKEKWGKEQEGKLTDEQTNQLGTRASNAAKKREKSITIVDDENLKSQEEAMNDYLLKYGSFTKKKEAIDKKYQSAIDKETDSWKKKSLQKEWDEEIANLDLSKLKSEINWEMIFGDLSKVTKDQLTKIKKQLQEFKKSPEFKNATPEQIQVIEGAINSINDAMVDKGGFFGGLADSLSEYEEAVNKVKEAQEELEEALRSGDEAAIEKAQKKKNAAEQNQANAQITVENSKDKAINNITAVANAMKQLGSAEFNLSSFGTVVGGLVDALSESGSKIGGIIAAILSLLDEFGKDGGVEFGKNIVNNVFSAIGGTIEQPFKMVFGVDFGLGGANYSEYDEMVAKYDSLLDVWDQLLDKKKAYIKESYGIEATKAGQEAIDLLNSEKNITKELASSRLGSGASAGSHSMSYRMWKGSYGYDGKNWKDVAPEISKALNGVDFSSMWSMLNMSSEQLEWIKINYSGLWANMDEDFRGYLDDIIQYGETEKEIIESINEQLTQTSFDSLFDSFLNTLMDMDSSSKDFANNFEEYMRKAIFTSMFAKNYEDELNEWYEAFAKANDKQGGMTASDVKDLRGWWDNIVNGAISDREAWEQVVGSSSYSSQSSTSKGFTAMSQDTGEELNGRFTALQIAGEETKNQNILQAQSLNLLTVKADSILLVNTESRNIADEIRTIQVNSYLELQEIRENTGAIIKPIKDMAADIAEVKKNTSKL